MIRVFSFLLSKAFMLLDEVWRSRSRRPSLARRNARCRELSKLNPNDDPSMLTPSLGSKSKGQKDRDDHQRISDAKKN